MFDDQPQNAVGGTPPPNLPVGEPEDIFEGTDKEMESAAQAPAAPVPPSALGAGVLKPKQPAAPMSDTPMPAPRASLPDNGMQSMYTGPSVQPVGSGMQPQNGIPNQPSMTVPPAGMGGMDTNRGYELKEPIGNRRVIAWIIIGMSVLVLGAGSVWIYFSFMRGDASDNVDLLNAPLLNDDDGDAIPPVITNPNQNSNVGQTVPDETPNSQTDAENIDQQILSGEPLDTDGDSLPDTQEAELKTDYLNWDTDKDGLGDGEEVMIWNTDPLKADTDGDKFKDGEEVKNGYNPKGPGKIFQPPTSTSS